MCLPVAMKGEGCSQRIVHGWSREQVGGRKETQQEDADRSLTCPVQGCSLGTACKDKYFSGQSSCLKCCNLKTRYLTLISTSQLHVFSNPITKLSSKQNLDAFEILLWIYFTKPFRLVNFFNIMYYLLLPPFEKGL